MTAAQLRDFVENQMKMSAHYQPVIIKNLVLARDGRLPADTLARELILEDPSQVARVRSVLIRMPKPVLTRHGIVRYDRTSGEFELLVNFDSEAEKNEIIQLCERRLESWRRTQGPSVRRASQDVVVFERARWRCQLCGAPNGGDTELQIDHIVPRSKRDRHDQVVLHGERMHYDDLRNKQALCGRCNGGKNNTRSVDYRPSPDWLAESVAYAMRLARFHGFDAEGILADARNSFEASNELPSVAEPGES